MGDAESGVTWFWVDEGIDTGPIAIQAAVPIPAESSPSKLYFETLVPLGARLYDELLAKLERGERPSIVQDESRADLRIATASQAQSLTKPSGLDAAAKSRYAVRQNRRASSARRMPQRRRPALSGTTRLTC